MPLELTIRNDDGTFTNFIFRKSDDSSGQWFKRVRRIPGLESLGDNRLIPIEVSLNDELNLIAEARGLFQQDNSELVPENQDKKLLRINPFKLIRNTR